MTTRTCTSFKREANVVRRDADGSIEPWTNLGDWDTTARRVNGHPDRRVGTAYTAAWARAVETGLSLGDAHDHANRAADRAAEELR